MVWWWYGGGSGGGGDGGGSGGGDGSKNGVNVLILAIQNCYRAEC